MLSKVSAGMLDGDVAVAAFGARSCCQGRTTKATAASNRITTTAPTVRGHRRPGRLTSIALSGMLVESVTGSVDVGRRRTSGAVGAGRPRITVSWVGGGGDDCGAAP